jgi:hypothetical protein
LTYNTGEWFPRVMDVMMDEKFNYWSHLIATGQRGSYFQFFGGEKLEICRGASMAETSPQQIPFEYQVY